MAPDPSVRNPKVPEEPTDPSERRLGPVKGSGSGKGSDERKDRGFYSGSEKDEDEGAVSDTHLR